MDFSKLGFIKMSESPYLSSSLRRNQRIDVVLLYNIHLMVYIGVIYNWVSSRVLSDLTHYVSVDMSHI